MTIFFFVLGVLVLFIGALVASWPDTRTADVVLCRVEEATSEDGEIDVLALELGARIFNSDDSRAVVSETWPDFARWFHSERKTLALDWLQGVRGHVRRIMREHRRAARQRSDSNPIQEVKLALQFFLFELTSGILYGFIWMRGPDDLATVVESLLEGAAELRKATEHALRPANPAAQAARN